jgi:SAM-dependent methyltransferase
MINFNRQDWLEQDRRFKTNKLKRLFYWFTRYLISLNAQNTLSGRFKIKYDPSLVLFTRGMPWETRRKWGSYLCNLSESTILVQGTGTGWDVISWARLKPKKIIAIDLFDFSESWNEITAYCQNEFNTEVQFRQSSLENIDFLPDESIDLCASDSVLEHCKDLQSVLQESWRVLKPKGSFYAAYGPLYFCSGGDHFSGRGGLENAFNHILLDQDNYKSYIQSHLLKSEDFQSGGRYIELNLFSKLTTNEYLTLFQQTGFLINKLIIEVSPESLKFKQKFPDLFSELLFKYDQKIVEEDLIIKSHLVRLIKKNK